MRELLIIGASGHGRVVADIAIQMNLWKEIYFLDDDRSKTIVAGKHVIGQTCHVMKLMEEYDVFVAIGSNGVRKKIFANLKKAGANLPVLIHPKAIIGSEVEFAAGTVVMPGAIINCGSQIGAACILNTGCTVDHDCMIGDYCHISPGAHLAGSVSIGQGSWVGVGVAVKNNIKITNQVIVGAGAVVVKDILQSGIYIGNPVKVYNK